ncbi:TonB-dependent receptor [Zunongwangia profunda]|uniref:carboxypeptidase-like regulatory domain-containing protein n=1 Tax=Zunongwangia profunda TaxID=398743 RepID=UPI0030D8EBA5
MKQLFLIIILTLSTFNSVANNEVFARITGTIIDRNLKEPVPYATISLSDTEGNIITGTTSEEDGSFIIKKVKSGNYILSIQFIGYKKFSKEIVVQGNSGLMELGTINLDPDVAEMDEVVVVGERSTIEQRIDRKVINVGKDLTTAGASASDIMNNIPSVNVDQDGNIALRGNTNVRILIDGKPTNMNAAQLLKQIPSSSIKKIELITNPSAKIQS